MRTEYGDNPRIEDTARWREVKTALDDELTPLGFRWTVQRHFGWAPEFIAQLKEYKAQHGHANPPQGYISPDGYRLGWRARHVRIQYSDDTRQHRDTVGALRTELEVLGFRWDGLRYAAYDEFTERLRTYAAEHDGNLSPPTKYVAPDGYRLGLRTMSLRAAYRRAAEGGDLPPGLAKTIEELDAMGFVWSVRPRRPAVRREALRASRSPRQR